MARIIKGHNAYRPIRRDDLLQKVVSTLCLTTEQEEEIAGTVKGWIITDLERAGLVVTRNKGTRESEIALTSAGEILAVNHWQSAYQQASHNREWKVLVPIRLVTSPRIITIRVTVIISRAHHDT